MPADTSDLKRRRNRLVIFWMAVGVLTAFAAFVLPFFFPRNQPVLSAAYSAGDNNRVAAIAVAAIMTTVALVCWAWKIAPPLAGRRLETRSQMLEKGWLVGAIAAVLLFTGVFGWLVVRAHISWGDSGYFIDRLRTGLILHRPIYTGFEFSYGILLYAWPAAFVKALAPLGVSMACAYMISLAAIQVLGIALLFFVVQAMPMRREMKAAIFVLLAFSTLTPLLGINYSIFRFILAFAGVVWLSRQSSIAAAATVAAFAEMLAIACSPEVGLAFGAAAVVYGIYRALVSSRHWVWVSVSGLAGATLFTELMERDTLRTMGKFAKGEFNLIIEPLPHMLVFLVAAAALAPLAVAAAVRKGGRNAGMLLALFVASVAVLPVALGRCDPLHVLCNGIGIYLLAFVAMDGAPRRWRRIWIVAVTAIVLLTQAVNFSVYKDSFRTILRRTPTAPDAGIDPAKLEAAIGSGSVAAPVGAPQSLVDELTRTGQYRPNYFGGLGWDAQAEYITIADMRQAEFALVPSVPLLFTEPIDNTRIKRILRLGYVYRQRRQPFIVGPLIDQELAEHWTPVGRFGGYTLYRRIS